MSNTGRFGRIHLANADKKHGFYKIRISRKRLMNHGAVIKVCTLHDVWMSIDVDNERLGLSDLERLERCVLDEMVAADANWNSACFPD